MRYGYGRGRNFAPWSSEVVVPVLGPSRRNPSMAAVPAISFPDQALAHDPPPIRQVHSEFLGGYEAWKKRPSWLPIGISWFQIPSSIKISAKPGNTVFLANSAVLQLVHSSNRSDGVGRQHIFHG
jgi:hypothetical protein